jgi:hypothetical protein
MDQNGVLLELSDFDNLDILMFHGLRIYCSPATLGVTVYFISVGYTSGEVAYSGDSESDRM